jgi:maleylacetate reductase
MAGANSADPGRRFEQLVFWQGTQGLVIHNYRNRVPAQIVSGRGCLAQLPDQLQHLELGSVFVISTASLENNGMLRQLESLLGDRHVGSYPGCKEHTPRSTVDEALSAFVKSGADCLLALGGGSVVDTVKALVYELSLSEGYFRRSLAIPTTLSVSEFTPFTGVMDDTTRSKSSVSDLRVIPELVLLDPECALETPRLLWLGTGLKALDHALEAIWAMNPHPISTVLARESVEKLIHYLPLSVDAEGDARLDALYQCQLGAWLGVSACLNTGGRLSHTLGHQIGGHWGVPHGFTSCVVLPPVMRFLSSSTVQQQQCIADAFQVDPSLDPQQRIERAAEKFRVFIQGLGLPTTLGETSADKQSIPRVARAVVKELHHQAASSEQLSEQQVSDLLLSMW